MKVQRKIFSVIFLLSMALSLTACASNPNQTKSLNTPNPSATEGKANASASSAKLADQKVEGAKEIRIKVTVGKQVLTAALIDNATTRSLIARFPLTVPMEDLYSREMCYRFADPLPANEAQQSTYEVGDISYWTPRHSFVIFYKQNGEVISNLQKIGRFDAGVELFNQTGNVDVTFELLENK